MKIISFSPVSVLAVTIFAVQQSGVTLSSELLISLIVNVALVGLAFGGIKADLRNLRKDLDKAVGDLEKGDSRVAIDLRSLFDLRVSSLESRVTKSEDRIERISSRIHRMANDLLASKLLDKFPEDERNAP